MRLKISRFLRNGLGLMIALICFSGIEARAGHLSGSLGYFNLAAKTSDGKTSINNMGLLRILYDHQVDSQFSLMLGYSIYSLRSLNSDMGYGLDFGAKYYPITKNKIVEETGRQIALTQVETFRPFVGVNFGQRQFQSIQSSYVGPGFEIGSEWVPNPSYFFVGSLRYLLLRGPAGSSLHDFSLSFGAGMPI